MMTAQACRDMVLLLLLALTGMAQARTLHQQQAQQEQYDAIIVGAGMAGVTAARNLTSAGLRVLVLEARDRAGGRLESTPVPGGHIDKGAMWIHNAVPGGNQLYDLVQQLALPISPQQNYNSRAIYTADGRPSNLRSLAMTFGAMQSQLVSRISRMRATPGTADLPLAAVYSDFLRQNNFSAEQVAQSNIMMHVYWQALLNGNVTKLSTLRLGDAKSIPAVDVMLKGGFPAVIDSLKQGLNIQYNKVVTDVKQDAEKVTVSTADGGSYTASHAVVTLPLSLLKAASISFDPPLPAEKTAAIAAMGYGLLDKTILVFNTSFWDNNDFLLREMKDWSGRFAIFLNYQKLFPSVKGLVAINVADTAQALEGMQDEEVVHDAMAALRQMYGPAIPDPIQSSVTRWAADPFSRGSYSFYATGNPKNITAVIGAPFGRVLFAGEAASEKPATVLGAYLSGLREGQRVADLVKAPTN